MRSGGAGAHRLRAHADTRDPSPIPPGPALLGARGALRSAPWGSWRGRGRAGWGGLGTTLAPRAAPLGPEVKDAGEDAGPGRPDSLPAPPPAPGAATAGKPRTVINSLGRVPRIKPGSCAATVKPSGAAGPLCVAEAPRFPTPELPPPPPSAQPPRARRGRGTVTAGGLRASPAWGRGAPTSKETPSGRGAHLPHSGKQTLPSNQENPPEAHT